MGDQPHIIELIDQLLSETAENPKLQEKIFDLRDALFQAQQVSQQYALEIKKLRGNCLLNSNPLPIELGLCWGLEREVSTV